MTHLKLFGSALFLIISELSANAVDANVTQTFPQIKVQIGKFQSRAIWTPVPNKNVNPTPVIILIPGSGAHGPEEMMPPQITGDGQSHALFNEFTKPLNQAGISTLQLGKPGVEFFYSFDKTKRYYDQKLYSNLHWQDLITNLREAVSWVKNQPGINPKKIYVLGHSEGTQVAVDYAQSDPNLSGVILLGYAGEDLSTIVEWQLFKRSIEDWIIPDVDLNHDGFVSKDEAAFWPEFVWDWKPSQNKVSYAEVEQALRNDPNLIAMFNKLNSSPLYADGVYTRGPIYIETASLTQDVYVFNGSVDEQTPAKESLKLEETCRELNKRNCFITIMSGLGHGFSPPRAPRGQPLIDATLGPVAPAFTETLLKFGKSLMMH